MQTIEVPTKKERKFLPQDLVIDSWEKLEPYFEDLKNREINSKEDLLKWMDDRSELEAVLEEDMAWRYIKMNIDTTDEKLAKDFQFFITEIAPKTAPYDDAFNRKLFDSPYKNELGKDYDFYLKKIESAIKVFREENIPLQTELQAESQKYGAIVAKMTVEVDGKELTLSQASKYLKDSNREKRKEVFEKISNRRLQDKDELNKLYSDLVKKRDKVAKNAGFDNFRDYKFVEMTRINYTPQDCFNFHDSIASEVVPVINKWDEERKQALGVDSYKPYDTEVDVTGKAPLKPFETGEELIDKSIEVFTRLRPSFGEKLAIMKELGYLDLESKKGKAPGGFNYPLYEIGVPFIYMNAVGTQQDLTTMVHEGGHAMQSFLTRDLPHTGLKSFPSEVAELASMSMELMSMDHWDVFYDNEEDLKRAKREQLKRSLSVLPWVATIDRFQHWVYENPNHTEEQRYEKWLEIMNTFGSSVIDWSGYDEVLKNLWQKQLHLYEVPFYYIEYGMAQLGAIAVWRNYKKDKEKGLDAYERGLSLGGTRNISEVYDAAGIKFDFSQPYVKELVDFVVEEMNKI